MKFKKLILLACTLSVLAIVMVACTNDNDGGGATPTTTTAAAAATPPAAETTAPTGGGAETGGDTGAVTLDDPFQPLRDALVTHNLGLVVQNDAPIMDGGTLTWAIGSTDTIRGVFCAVHWIHGLDADMRMFFAEPLLNTGLDLHVSNITGTAGTLDYSRASAYFDRDARTVTITKNHASYWHDGVPVTMDDLKFAIEVIAHPDYTGPRWGANISNIVGAVEYRAGYVDYIAGLVLSEDQMTLTMYMIDFPPTISAFSFWSTPLPRHHWEGIPVSEMENHPNARHNVLGDGPFIIDGIVPGESVRFVRNDNFWRGRPNLDVIIAEIVDPMMVPMAMEQGMYDIASFPQSQFTEQFRYMNNVQFLANPFTGNATTWLIFRSGTWDPDLNDGNGGIYTFEEQRLSDTVRLALALSIDHMTAAELFNGLVVPNGSVYFGLRNMQWIDTSIPTHNNFDPERAERLLDEAGYLRGADGYRTFPDGSELTIIYAAATGSPANELNRALELQNWSDIGLRVELYQGRLVEAAVLTGIRNREEDGGVVDMFTSGWGLGANPNPRNIFGPATLNNHTRYTSDEWNYIIERFESEQMWDPDFLMETVTMWQHAVSESMVMFPTTIAIGLQAVNNRVANFSLDITGDTSRVSSWNPWLWGLTNDTAYVRTN